MSVPDDYPWTYNLVWKLLHNNRDVVGLFAHNPFPQHPPKYIRAILYRYKLAKPGNKQHLFWTRENLGEWMPAMSVNDPQLIAYLRYKNWLPVANKKSGLFYGPLFVLFNLYVMTF